MKGPHTRRGESPPRGMQTIGLDIGETNKRNLAARRSKKGECPTCGIRTHKIGMFGKKTPMSVDGECVAGRCLRCQPLEGYRTRPAPAQVVQASPFLMQPAQPIEVGRDIVVQDDDDDNMSGITMDDALRDHSTRWRQGSTMEIMGGLQEEEDEDFANFPPPPQLLRRPEPSIVGDDFQPEPHHGSRRRYSRTQQPDAFMDSFGNMDQDHLEHQHPASVNMPVASSRHSQRLRDSSSLPSPDRAPEAPRRRLLSPRRDNFLHTRLPSEIEEEKNSSSSSGLRQSGSTNLSYPVPLIDTNGNKPDFPQDLQYYDDEQEEKNEIQAPLEAEAYRVDHWPNQDSNYTMNERTNSRRQQHRTSRSEPAEISFVPDERPPREASFRQGSSRRNISPPRSSHQRHGRTTPSPPRMMHGRLSPPLDRVATPPQPFDPTGSGITKIPGIIRRLESGGDPDPRVRGEVLQSLADIVWISGDEAKLMIQNNNGIEMLEKCMWADIGSGRVQIAAVDLLCALSACSEDGMGRDIFIRESGQSVIDALLISMQTHISVESLQRSGCGALACLASASHENRRVDDGTLSGATSCVVAAMDAHRKSLEVQKWGLWALYCQCVLSPNAESSQLNLAEGAIEAGGLNVIFRAMDINDSDMMVLEWGCKLYWALSFSDTISGMLAETNRPIMMIVKVLRFYQGNLHAPAVEAAAYGALANISRVKKTHAWLREFSIISRVCESMDTYNTDVGVNTEACSLLANISDSPPLREAALSYSLVKILRAMESFPNSAELHEEALRALLSFSVESDDAKSELCKEQNLNLIMDAISNHQRSPLVLEMGLALVASFCVGRTSSSTDLNEVVDILIMAMKRFPDERKLQEVVCLLLRNLSCREQELVVESEDFFPCILQIMKAQADSDTIQLNLCCVLSNLLAKEQGITCARVDDGMSQLVGVIQTHMASAPVLEMACAALWLLICNSESCKMSFVETGGVEYVKTALLMHPSSPDTLEKVCGVLSCLSGNPSHVRLIAEDQGISYVVETMRTNPTAISLLEYASIILRNAVSTSVDYAPEASGGISPIITALRDNHRTPEFDIEACHALWVMSAQSEDCRQKILALDGYEVLIGLENNDPDATVREAARGACNQLLIPSNNERILT